MGGPEMVSTNPSEGHDRWPTRADGELLPAGFDRLVPIGQLVHGQHNPRKETPSPALQRSIANHGVERPLIVHQSDDGMYYITDGWQRYQAAVNADWEQLPVNICKTATEAIRKTERESLGKDYSVYHWARLCWAYATEVSDDSVRDVARKVAQQLDNARSMQTVTRYLRVLSLPEEIHPLLTDGPDGTQQDWQALCTHNPDIKRYDGLSWVVAEEITKHADTLDAQRAIGIAANAVVFNDRKTAKQYIRRAAESPELLPETVLQQVQFNGQRDRTVKIPQVVMSVPPEDKRALMRHLHQTRTTLPQFVESQTNELIREITERDSGNDRGVNYER
jgi:ParB/RepB/Spo0J family partition protein